MKHFLTLALIAASPAAIASTPFPTGQLTIGGEAFAVADILDARAMPDINGKVGLMISLNPAAAKRLEVLSGSLIGKPMMIALDGKALAGEMIRKPITGGVIELPGRWNLTDGEALARRISGRDPLPDDLAE